MIEVKEKQILIDGKPEIIMCGEIHYFRLDRSDWQDRIDKLKQAGCNAVASYVPWICHEEIEGQVDLTGVTRSELDLPGFIDLCAANDLYFFLRPGPFIMAEMKNEGIPGWLINKYPELLPITWDGEKTKAKTLDYTAPAFLKHVEQWYAEVMAIAAPRLQPNGGNIIAVQLDNEIGMLSWVSNCPDLTDHSLTEFVQWLYDHYQESELVARYPFLQGELSNVFQTIRSPEETYAASLHLDLGYYMRHRFATYVARLRGFAEANHVKDIPFIVNIHGMGAGRGFTFPIGISQLYESYTQAEGYLSGSDIYFGDLNMDCFQDLYLINGMMDAVHRPEQPLTSVEFNCGDGNFGNNYSGRKDPSAADFKARMCIAQGARLVNYYLMAGGRNYRLSQKSNDGNDRIAHTGERHGFAAPISPEGELNYTFPRMARSIQTIRAVADKLAVMKEQKDDVSFAFIPDYYMTESCYPASERTKQIQQNITENRSHAVWENMARAMLLGGYRFGAADIQNNPIDTKTTKVLALPSARYMARSIQEKLVAFLEQGGSILLYGEVPSYDMEGNSCELLANTLGARPKTIHYASQDYALSVYAAGWARDRAEIRVHKAQVFDFTHQVEPLLRVYGKDDICGFECQAGNGKAIVIGTPYVCDIALFTQALGRLGSKARLTHDCKTHGIFMTSTTTETNETFIHLLNLDGFEKETHIYYDGEKLFDGRRLHITAREGMMFPINIDYGEIKVKYATAEIIDRSEQHMTFRLTQPQDIIVLETDRHILPSEAFDIDTKGNTYQLISKQHAKLDDCLIVRFADH
ncbi:beta-galactosidase [Gracilibacillus alcaliphilus]|uniref:beta-galactosidase n=1 Tax=Gracilibacillus alcaliphilus TaxID=1401441 RepID=UPI00195ABB35|nr:beta-galactosidase [Gracilibacillus alcaliphilus]MBM7675247.1 beta-galactosidase [Gracilibacillus alcaliphilus]